jgi:hypothetical protein
MDASRRDGLLQILQEASAVSTERSGYVHATWVFSNQGIHRARPKPKFLTIDSPGPETVVALTNRINSVMDRLLRWMTEYQSAQSPGATKVDS